MKRLTLVMALAATAGCAALGRQAFQQPRVELLDVRVVGLGVTGGELEVALGVRNPNGFRLDASRLTYRVFVSDSVTLAGGEMDSRATVQADDSTVIRIPVAFSYAGLGAAARQLLQTGIVSYRVTGDVTVASVVGNFTVPFTTTGRYSTLRR
ncbi:MAG: LEA type 2 family protein [Gemmatimonadota bacterium]